MEFAEYDERAGRLQADLEERAPVLIWRAWRALETTGWDSIGPEEEMFRVDAHAHVNGRHAAREINVSLEFLDDQDTVIEWIVSSAANGLARLMASREVEEWTAPSAVTGSR